MISSINGQNHADVDSVTGGVGHILQTTEQHLSQEIQCVKQGQQHLHQGVVTAIACKCAFKGGHESTVNTFMFCDGMQLCTKSSMACLLVSRMLSIHCTCQMTLYATQLLTTTGATCIRHTHIHRSYAGSLVDRFSWY